MNTEDAAMDGGPAGDKAGSLRALSLLNFFVSDVQTGMGPYLTLFLRQGLGWDAGRIGGAVGAGYLALVIAQVPVGAWIDGTRRKRALIVLGAALVAAACLATALLESPPIVTGGQALIGLAGAILPPCIAAITLGMVGRARMDARQGLNQSWNAAGNVAAAIATGLVGQFLGLRWMFAVLAVFCSGAVFCVQRIRPGDINDALARGADGAAVPEDAASSGPRGAEPKEAARHAWDDVRGLGRVLRDRNVLVFTASALLLNLSNGAMAPLVTQQFAAQRSSHYAPLWVGGFMIAVQLVYMLVAARAGRLAGSWGRKPLFAAAFAAVVVRGLLLSLGHGPAYLVAVQSVDGIVAGLSSVVSTLILADLTRGTGRFNVAQGAFAAAQGIGASASNAAFGALYRTAGAHTSFLALAGVAAVGLLFFWGLMPETRTTAPEPAEC